MKEKWIFIILENSFLKMSKCAYLRAGTMKQYKTELQRVFERQLFMWDGNWVDCHSLLLKKLNHFWMTSDSMWKTVTLEDTWIVWRACGCSHNAQDPRSACEIDDLLQGSGHALGGAMTRPSRSHLGEWSKGLALNSLSIVVGFPLDGRCGGLIHTCGLVFTFVPLDLFSWQTNFLSDTSKQSASLQRKFIKAWISIGFVLATSLIVIINAW